MSIERRTIPTPVQGTEFVADLSGPDDGPVVVWVHGEFGELDGVPSRDTLAGSARVVELHLPGWGVAGGGDRFDHLHELATATWWALDELRIDRAVLAGHGFGAALAVELTIQQPGRVDSLVLAAPFGLFRTDDPGVDMFALLPKDLLPGLYADPTSDAVVRHFPVPADAYERGLSAIRRVEVLGATSRYLFPIPDTNVAGRAYRLANVPTTILFGAADGVVPVSLADDWRALFPHAEVSVVDDAAHMLPYETDDVATALAAAVAGRAVTV